IRWRNGTAHGTTAVSDVEPRHAQLLALLPPLRFLADYQLMVPLELAAGDRGTITAKVVCMGPYRDFVAEDCSVGIPEALRDEVVEGVSPLLLDLTQRRVLLALYPLALFDNGPPCEELYNYRQSTWQGRRPHSLRFGPNQPGLEVLHIRRGEDP